MLAKVRIPNAVPYLFTALKIAAPIAVITAFVAEYFGGNQNGLGYGITSNAAASRSAASWAYVVGACVLGLSFYLVAIALERVCAPGFWAARARSTRTPRATTSGPRSTHQQPAGDLVPGGAATP